MRITAHSGVLAVADDLSGAAEVGALLGRRANARIELRSVTDPVKVAYNAQSGLAHALSGRPSGSLVIDLDSREAPAEVAERAVARTIAGAGAGTNSTIFVKIDSLLRGNVAATVSGAYTAPVVIAPALPQAGRTVRGGVPRVHGKPLHESSAWSARSRDPATTIARIVAPAPTRVVGLDTVRSDRLARELSDCVETGLIPVCDGETSADLDAVVTAAIGLPGVRLVGSGGLAAALAAHLYRVADPEAGTIGHHRHPGHGPLLVVGTAEPGAARQVRRLAETGVPVIAVDARTSKPSIVPGEDLAERLSHGPVVLTLDEAVDVDPARAPELVARLAEFAGRILTRLAHPVDLVLTGGETARRVLDAIHVDTLFPLTQVHHGAVHSRTPQGAAVVTRPGSFGDADSLARIVEHLRSTTEGRA